MWTSQGQDITRLYYDPARYRQDCGLECRNNGGGTDRPSYQLADDMLWKLFEAKAINVESPRE